MQCWEEWHRQKCVVEEARVLGPYVNSRSHRSGVPWCVGNGSSEHESGICCDVFDVSSACPWIVLQENRQPKKWYWGPQPKCVWDIQFMAFSCYVDEICGKSFKELCAQHGLMVVMYCGRPALYCAVCGKYAEPSHFNQKHIKKCTRSVFSQMIRPGCDVHGRDYRTTLMDFYEELVHFPLFWGTELWAIEFP